MNTTVNFPTFNVTSKMTKKHVIGSLFFCFVFVSISYLLYSTVSWMLDEQRLPLSKVVIQGELAYTSDQDVQRALGKVEHIGTFMSQDVDELQQALIQLPWVFQASIRKQWPDIIKVYLVEHKASAIWNGTTLLNDTGDIFNGDVAQLTEEKVKLYGPEKSSKDVLATWRASNPLFAPLGLSIDSLVLNDRRAWQIILDNGIRLELGKESLTERIERFISLYYRLGSKTEKISYIDLRYDTGAAVGWFPEQEIEQESIND
ncbi:cell division protein FtsQ/DivIB [Vibrio sp. 99-8-1]|nr:FtsQ-type POTRA domain-containing protein [Vibrio sp. 99-8-1]